jgi:hypothetical protein
VFNLKSPEVIQDSINQTPISQKSQFIKFVKNPSMIQLIEYLPLISFLIANYFILKIFDYFLNFYQFTILIIPPEFTFWVYFLIGVPFSLFLIKTNFMMKIKTSGEDFLKFLINCIKFFINFGSKMRKLTSNWNLFDIFLMSIRNLFFNILNDLFILTIFWASFFTILYCFGELPFPKDFVFTSFFEAISVIGILSGFFQFYTTEYKKQSTDLIQSFTKSQLKILQEITVEDFFDFLYRKGEEKLAEKISDKVLKTDKVFSDIIHHSGFRPQQINLYSIPSQGYSNSLSTFQIIDMHATVFKEINKAQLNRYYDEYFSEKLYQFKMKFDSYEIGEMRKMIFSTIVFSDEVLSSLSKVIIDFPDETESPKNFSVFYQRFTVDCLNVLLDKLMNFDE